MTTMTSYAAGSAEIALLEETIGHNFNRTASTYPDVEALVDVPSGRRWTYAELDAEVDLVARALMRKRHPAGRPRRASGRPTAPSGRSCSTPPRRSARSW